MASQSLASLVVDLKLNHAELKKGVDVANAKLGSFEKQLASINNRMKGLSATAALSFGKELVTGLAHFVMKGAEAADKMGKLAQSVGIPVEALSKLDYAAGLAGLSTEELGSSIGKLDKNLAAAAAGSKNSAAVFQALGIAVKDGTGHVRSAESVLGDLADRFAGFKDDAAKTALAMELFGKSGASMIPFLNQGRDGIAQLTAEAEKFGLVVSAQTAAAAEQFNDSLEKVQRISQGVAMRVAGQLAPALTNIIDRFLKAKDASETLKMAVTGITSVIKGLISVGFILGAVFETVGKGFARVASAMVSASEGRFDELLHLNAGFVSDALAATNSAVDNIKTLWADTGAEQSFDRQSNASKKSADSVISDIERIRKAKEDSEFDLSIKSNELTRKAEDKRAQHSDIVNRSAIKGAFGLDTTTFDRLTAGFKDLDDALDQATQAEIGRQRELAEASHARAVGDIKGAEFALLAADAQAQVAQQANAAADAFMDMAKRQAEAMDGLIQNFTKELGSLGEVVNAAAQGFQAGGVWGALIAAILQILTYSEQWGKFVEQLDGIFQMLGNAIGSILEGITESLTAFQPLFDVIGNLLKAVIGALNSGAGVGRLFMMLGKIVQMVVIALDPLIKLFDGLAGILEVITLMGPVMKIVGVLFAGISLSLLATQNALLMFWGMILRFARWIAEFLRLDLTGIDKTIADNQANIESVRNQMAQVGAGVLDTFKHFFDDPTTAGNTVGGGLDAPGAKVPGADAYGNATDSVEKFGEKLDEVTDKLTNVPAGYKVAEERYKATLAQTASATLDFVWNEMQSRNRRSSFVQNGNPYF